MYVLLLAHFCQKIPTTTETDLYDKRVCLRPCVIQPIYGISRSTNGYSIMGGVIGSTSVCTFIIRIHV